MSSSGSTSSPGHPPPQPPWAVLHSPLFSPSSDWPYPGARGSGSWSPMAEGQPAPELGAPSSASVQPLAHCFFCCLCSLPQQSLLTVNTGVGQADPHGCLPWGCIPPTLWGCPTAGVPEPVWRSAPFLTSDACTNLARWHWRVTALIHSSQCLPSQR